MLIPEFRRYYMQLRSGHPFEYALLFTGPALLIVCSAFALLGHNWARWLILAWVGFLAVANAWNSNFMGAVQRLVLFAIVAYYLFRPLAKAFFKGPFQVVLVQTEGTSS